MHILSKSSAVQRADFFSPSEIKRNHDEIIRKLSKKTGRGTVLDVFELEGCYALDNSEQIFMNISVGDKLEISACSGDGMLIAKLPTGVVVGFVPFSISLLPEVLISKSVKVFCYVEYKDLTNGVLTICVSMYSDTY